MSRFRHLGEAPASQSIRSFFIRTSPASSANRAESIRFFLLPRAGPYLLFDVQVFTPKTPAALGQITEVPTRYMRRGSSCF